MIGSTSFATCLFFKWCRLEVRSGINDSGDVILAGNNPNPHRGDTDNADCACGTYDTVASKRNLTLDLELVDVSLN